MNLKNVTITTKIVSIPAILIAILTSIVFLTFNAFDVESTQFEDIGNELKIIQHREEIKDNIMRLQIFLLINTIQKHSQEHKNEVIDFQNLNPTQAIENFYQLIKQQIYDLKEFIIEDYGKHLNEHNHRDLTIHDEDLHIKYLRDLAEDFNNLSIKVDEIYGLGKKLPENFHENYESGMNGIYNLMKLANEIELNFQKFDNLTDTNFENMSKDFNNGLEQNKNIFIIIGIFGLILSLILSVLIIKSIKESIFTLKSGMLSFFDFLNRKNKNSHFISLNSKDEFSEMAKVINENIKSISTNVLDDISVVKKIANGDYSVAMNIKTENDVFAKSMNLMIDKLRENKELNDEQNWIKDALTELNNQITGDLTSVEISSRAIIFISNHLKAGVGALYVNEKISDENILKLYGSYAFIEREDLSNKYKFGEGVIGQVALQKSPILLKNISRSQMLITTGTTSESPINSYTFPLLYENELYGVIEVASHQLFSKIELEFLNSSNRIVATHLFASIQNEKIKELLKESKKSNETLSKTNDIMNVQQKKLEESYAQMEEQQQQLEEANAQMEEQQQQLEAINAELEEQKQQLQSSALELLEKNSSLMKSQEELDKKAKDLEMSNKYKSEFLANMSHELRTPLNSIILLSKMLSKNKEGHLDEKDVKKVTVINQAGNELLRLINDILDLSKVEAGKMSVNATKINSKVILEQFCDMFEHIAVEKGLKFIINSEFEINFINDEDKLSQIIRNLLSNAFKFTKDGFIELGVSKSRDNERPIEFYVKDSGIGIAKDKQDLIFDAFSQADGSTSREYGGTGLGLSITREFAKLMNAKVILESEEGKGSKFSILLPKTIQGLSIIETKENKIIYDDRNNISQNSEVMLIIEDDINFAEILKERVNAKGLKALIAQTGKDGLFLAKKYQLKGILLDLSLPDIYGIEVLRELKKNDNKTRHIPVHIISGQNRDILPQKLGAIGFIQKPAKEEEIDFAIAKIFEVNKKSPKHILIVEDDKTQQEALIHLIEQKDIKLQAVDSVENAIKELNKNIYDTIIIDLGLKIGNGYEICDYIKVNHIQTPIIIYTGKNLSEDEIDKLRQYTDSIILKTANSDERLLEDIDLFLHNVKEVTPKKEEKITILNSDLKNKTILVVDDDVKNIFVLSSALEEQGAEIFEAKNGQIALDVLRKNSDIDLVLMDIMMPTMDGYEAMSEIRKDENLKHLPIIAVTAKAMKDDRDKCIEAGADDYISKPIDLDLLIKMSKAWVNKNKS